MEASCKKMKFSKELIEARKEAGLTQTEISKRLEIPQRTYESWEQGKRTPPKYFQKMLLNQIKNLKNN